LWKAAFEVFEIGRKKKTIMKQKDEEKNFGVMQEKE
jgi:hypothetical protein